MATALLVDQARVCADPQATLLILLPCKAATRRGRWMALVLPSPSWPSSLSPQVKTSPREVINQADFDSVLGRNDFFTLRVCGVMLIKKSYEIFFEKPFGNSISSALTPV